MFVKVASGWLETLEVETSHVSRVAQAWYVTICFYEGGLLS